MKCKICNQEVVEPVRVCGTSRCPWCGNILEEVVDEKCEETLHTLINEHLPEDDTTTKLIVEMGGDPTNEIWQAVVGEVVETEKWMWIEEHLGVEAKIKYIEGLITWEECVRQVVQLADG